MLTRWRLANFKSIRGPLDLELAPITVLSGLNSSGKSSVLQSIRLVAQTLRNATPTRPLVINGYDVILGDFNSILNSDIRHSAFNSRREAALNIGFDLRLSFSDTDDANEDLKLQMPIQPTIHEISTQLIRMNFEFCFDPRRYAPTRDSNFTLKGGTIELSGQDPPLVRAASIPEDGTNSNLRDIHDAQLRYDALTDEQGDQLQTSLSPMVPRFLFNKRGINYFANVRVSGDLYNKDGDWLALLEHFMPRFLVEKYLLSERRRMHTRFAIRLMLMYDPNLFDGINNIFPLNSADFENLLDRALPPELLSSISDILGNNFRAVPVIHASSIGELMQFMRQELFEPHQMSPSSEVVEQVADELLRYLLPESDGVESETGLEIISRDPVVDVITEATRRTTEFFVRSIRYLGPLRLDPTEAQSFSPASEPDEVGPKGEFAAVVFDANAGRLINWWNPDSSSVESGSLAIAVNTWLRYLGVATEARVSESSAIGVTWRIRIGTDRLNRPLGSVGVGVSQVLPILIAGLLAPEGALLLIEQPELHLHPRAQSRLAEFFWGLSRTGRRCVIETHSEAMVNGFRLLTVGGSPAMQGEIAIYFSQLLDRESKFESVVIGSDGLIENWPDGFFDENQVLEDRITSAAIRARALQK